MIPVVRAYPKPNRKKKVLRSIENTHVNETSNSSSSKPKKNNRKRGKAKVKNNEVVFVFQNFIIHYSFFISVIIEVAVINLQNVISI